MTCNICKTELKREEWPWNFRGILQLCQECKIKVYSLLKSSLNMMRVIDALDKNKR